MSLKFTSDRVQSVHYHRPPEIPPCEDETTVSRVANARSLKQSLRKFKSSGRLLEEREALRPSTFHMLFLARAEIFDCHVAACGTGDEEFLSASYLAIPFLPLIFRPSCCSSTAFHS